MGASQGVESPWSYLACESPCCDQENNFLVENHPGPANRLGFANIEHLVQEGELKEFSDAWFLLANFEDFFLLGLTLRGSTNSF